MTITVFGLYACIYAGDVYEAFLLCVGHSSMEAYLSMMEAITLFTILVTALSYI